MKIYLIPLVAIICIVLIVLILPFFKSFRKKNIELMTLIITLCGSFSGVFLSTMIIYNNEINNKKETSIKLLYVIKEEVSRESKIATIVYNGDDIFPIFSINYTIFSNIDLTNSLIRNELLLEHLSSYALRDIIWTYNSSLKFRNYIKNYDEDIEDELEWKRWLSIYIEEMDFIYKIINNEIHRLNGDYSEKKAMLEYSKFREDFFKE